MSEPAVLRMRQDDRMAWQDLLSTLPDGQRKSVHSVLGPLGSGIDPPSGPALSWAVGIVKLMEVNPQVYRAIDTHLKALRAFTPGVRLARWRRVLLQRNRGVPIIGFQVGVQYDLPIRDIYVPVSMHWGAGRDSDTSAAGEQPIQAYLAELERRHGSDKYRDRGLAIIGEPGSGKTTLLKHLLCEVLADGSAAVGLPRGYSVVFLRFSRLAQLADPAADGGVLRAMIEEEARHEGHPGAGDALVASGAPLLVLLDGLDEVRDQADLDRVCTWLAAEVDRWPDARFVLTCRPPAWARAEAWLTSRFLRLDVRRFKMHEVRSYVGRWFHCVLDREAAPGAVRESWEAAAAASAKDLVDVLDDPDHPVGRQLGKMARNPLLLSVICLVQHKSGRLPDSRARLYEQALHLLLTDWAMHRDRQSRGRVSGRQHSSVPYQPDEAMDALAPLAWALQDRQTEPSASATEIDDDEAAALVAQTLELLPAVVAALTRATALDDAGKAFLKHVREDSGVLVESAIGRLSFAHLTFQEYLAARDAVRRHNTEDRETVRQPAAEDLAARVHDPRWREPLLLAMGQGLFLPFMRAVLRRSKLPDEAFLRECLEQSGKNDLSPFAEWLVRAATPPTQTEAPALTFWQRLGLVPRPEPPDPPVVPDAQAIATILRVCSASPTAAVRAAARPHASHVDPGVASLARRVAGLESEPVTAPAGVESAGARRVLDAGGVRMELVWVPPGAFDRKPPPHRVTLTQGFWLGRFPVTNAQYLVFVRAEGHDEPSSFIQPGFEPDDHPVAGTNWQDAQAFCAWWSKQLPGGEMACLPTEAEWEWAARGGPEQGNPSRTYPWGDEEPDHRRAWFDDERNEPKATAPVGQRPAGAGPFGAEDQAGNVWEWCEDLFAEYDPGDTLDPCRRDVDTSTASPADRVLRGGSWFDVARVLRCGNRFGFHPEGRVGGIGFRVVVRGPPA